MTPDDRRSVCPPGNAELPFARSDDHTPLDVVFVEGLTAMTVIGIHDNEQGVRQPVRVDAAVGVPRIAACQSDRIGDTVDYGRVREALLDLLDRHAHGLLEALAESMAQRLLADFGAHWVRVVVAKPRKFADVDAVGVAIERHRASPEGRRGPRELTLVEGLGAGMFPRTPR